MTKIPPSSFSSSRMALVRSSDNDESEVFTENEDFENFTSDLCSNLIASKSQIQKWAERTKERIDVEAEAYRVQVARQQQLLNEKSLNLLTMQQESGLPSSVLSSLSADSDNAEEEEELIIIHKSVKEIEIENEQAQVKQKIENIQKEVQEKEDMIQDLEDQIIQQRQQAQQAQEWHNTVQSSQRAALHDLTRHIQKYQMLGLEFERASDESLRFTFSLLDPKDPSRKFGFLLKCDEMEDAYKVLDWDKDVLDDPQVVADLVQALNESDDMSAFIRGMRKAFAASRRSTY